MFFQGLGLDPDDGAMVEAYSPSGIRSFTPPPQGLPNPLLEKVSNITIPNNLQEILANIKRQECTKNESGLLLDSTFLPTKPGATFMTLSGASPGNSQDPEKYSPTFTKSSGTSKLNFEESKEPRSTLSTLSDDELIRKAAEQFADMENSKGPAMVPEDGPIAPIFANPPPPGCADDEEFS